MFEGNIFSQRSAAVRQCAYNDAGNTSKLVIKNSSLMRGVDPNALALYPDRMPVIIIGDSGFGTEQIAGVAVDAFDYINAEFINTEIIKNADTTITANLDPSTDNGLVCTQGLNSKIYFKSCDIIDGIENQTPLAAWAVAGFNGVGSLDDGNAEIYFKDTHSNRNYKGGSPGAVNETNSGGSNDAFVVEAACRTLNYLHKI